MGPLITGATRSAVPHATCANPTHVFEPIPEPGVLDFPLCRVVFHGEKGRRRVNKAVDTALCTHPVSPSSASGWPLWAATPPKTSSRPPWPKLQQHLRDFLPAPLLVSEGTIRVSQWYCSIGIVLPIWRDFERGAEIEGGISGTIYHAMALPAMPPDPMPCLGCRDGSPVNPA